MGVIRNSKIASLCTLPSALCLESSNLKHPFGVSQAADRHSSSIKGWEQWYRFCITSSDQ
jgi:hypothetical protein